MWFYLLIQLPYYTNYMGIQQQKGVEMFKKMMTTISNYKKFKRTEKELYTLTDRELNDLGISRGDISRIARGSVVGY